MIVDVFPAIVETELDTKKHLELRTFELDQALKKPKTTVVELRAFERCMWNSIAYCHIIISNYDYYGCDYGFKSNMLGCIKLINILFM